MDPRYVGETVASRLPAEGFAWSPDHELWVRLDGGEQQKHPRDDRERRGASVAIEVSPVITRGLDSHPKSFTEVG